MYVSNFNTYLSADTGLIANNEIILNAASSTTTYGIQLVAPSHLKLFHNSIFVSGNLTNDGASRGIHVAGNNVNDIYEIKNNNIVISHSGAYPISINSATYLNLYDIDYNNLFAPKYVGYVDSGRTSMASWQKRIVTDKHSVSILPPFIDSTQNLKLTAYTGLACPITSLVENDLENSFRVGDSTTMGAYHGYPALLVNASLTEILHWREGLISGESDTISVVLYNTGTSALTNATIAWTFNGASKSAVTWTGNLAVGQSTVINLGTVTYAVAENALRAWISGLGTLTDNYHQDDTISISGYVCGAPLAGTYTVGVSSGNHFATLTDALNRLRLCGASANVVFELKLGTYQQSMDLTDMATILGSNSLTITSATHKAKDVVLVTEKVGVKLSQSNNIVLKDITIDATKGTYAVQFAGACTNVVIRDCRLLTDTATALSAYPICKDQSTGVVDSIFIINNLLDGGYTGFFFHGGTAAQYGTHIVFDSNTVSNSANNGVNANYVDFVSCSYNTVLSRKIPVTGVIQWYGFSMYYNNGPVIGNRIIQRSTDITVVHGMYFASYSRYNTTDTGFIVNNEIICTKNSSGSALSVESSRAKILHNSIFVTVVGTSGMFGSTAKGINITDDASSYTVIRNNNVVMNQTTATGSSFPIYLTTYNPNSFNIDYNNMYASTYVGHVAGTNISDTSTWRKTVTTDKNSVSILPDYIDSTVNLELADYSTLLCPFYPGATKDIQGNIRANTTVMGAYAGFKLSMDLGLQNIICNNTTIYSQPLPVSIEIINMGSSVKIDSATFGWSVNGVVKPSRTWIANNPLTAEESAIIAIGQFHAMEKTNVFDIVVWIESVNGKKDSITWNDTASLSIKILFTGKNLRALSVEKLVEEGLRCTEDYTSLKIRVENTGASDYDFAADPVTFSVRVSKPEPFSLDTVFSKGKIKSGEIDTLELTDRFPIVVAGVYDIEVFLHSLADTIKYDDTIRHQYLSGRFKLPIDEYFNSSIPNEFDSKSNNSLYKWRVIAQGTGADTVVKPQFGNGMLSFSGSPGSMATLSTQQLDLSKTVRPSLSFWYFHDTVPCEEYTDVRMLIDGKTTSTLVSLTKYNAVYGWKQYSMDLPGYAVNQCVILIFEAMEKSPAGNVTQYIDRIRITAKRDVELAAVLTSGVTACNMKNKAWQIVLTNHTDPVLDFSTTPIKLVLEITGTPSVFTKTLNTDVLSGFSSDTITLTPSIDFSKGTFKVKAWFTSVLDDTPMNDTLLTSVVVNPNLSVRIHPESRTNKCLAGEVGIKPTVTLYNKGNMDLSNIELVLRIDTGEAALATYATFKEIYTNTIAAGDSLTYIFTNSFSVPWNAIYYAGIVARLQCDSTLLTNNKDEITECVDTKDLYIVNIDNPSSSIDHAGSPVQVRATLRNRSDMHDFTRTNVTVSITNSRGVQMETFTEIIDSINHSSPVKTHTFAKPYTVPNDTLYYLTVYINSSDIYLGNDTMTITRRTDYVGINAKTNDRFALAQNIPNPATNTTRIDYSIPEAGTVVFHIHTITGQLLYSQTIEAEHGNHSIKLNTNTFSPGLYYYSIEYKGQRLVKRMSVK
jgi:hypothetical protein